MPNRLSRGAFELERQQVEALIMNVHRASPLTNEVISLIQNASTSGEIVMAINAVLAAAKEIDRRREEILKEHRDKLRKKK